MIKDFPSRIQIPSTIVGYLSVLFAAASWGTSGIAVNLIQREDQVTALALAFYRDISTFLILFVGLLLLRPSWLQVKRRDLPWLAALGTSLGTFHVFWNLGVMLNGAPVATVQQAAMPAIVALVAWMIWQEPMSWRKILAILLTFAGTVLVSGLDELRQSELSTNGILIGLGIPILYAAWNLFGKKVRQDYNALTVLTYAFGFGALVLLPFQFFTEQPWPIQPITGLRFAGLILVSTIAPFFAYLFALGRLLASTASILAMTEIAFVSFYAYTILDEWMTSGQIFGTILVVAGTSLLFWRKSSQLNQARRPLFRQN